MDVVKAVTLAGRGVLAGLGLGTSAYGLFFLSLSFKEATPFNLGALIAVFAGGACLFLAITLKKKA